MQNEDVVAAGIGYLENAEREFVGRDTSENKCLIRMMITAVNEGVLTVANSGIYMSIGSIGIR